MGQNGIISRAQEASEITTIANEKEAITLAYSACKMDDYQSDVSSQDLQDELNRNNHNVTVTTLGNNLKVLFNDTGHMYTVGQDGNVTDENEDKQKGIKKVGIISSSQYKHYTGYCELNDGRIVICNFEPGTYVITGNDEFNETISNVGIRQKFENGFVDNDGKVYTWGNNEYGQVGNGTNENQLMPVCISDIDENALYGKNIISASSTQYTSVALDDSGNIYVWGVLLDSEGNAKIFNTPICLENTESDEFKNITILEANSIGGTFVFSTSNGKMYTVFQDSIQNVSDIEGSPLKDIKIKQYYFFFDETINTLNLYIIDEDGFLFFMKNDELKP